MKKLFKSLAVLSCVATLAAPIATYACDGEGRHGKRHGGPEQVLRQLDLTTEQQAQVEHLFAGKRETRQVKHAEAKAIKQQIRQAEKAGEVDVAEQLHQQLNALKKQQRVAHRSERKQLQSILNAEQFDKFESIVEQRRQQRFEKRGQKKADRPVSGAWQTDGAN